MRQYYINTFFRSYYGSALGIGINMKNNIKLYVFHFKKALKNCFIKIPGLDVR